MPSRLRLGLQRISWRVPEWWSAAAVLAAWGAIVVGAFRPESPLSHAGHLHQMSPAQQTPALGLNELCLVGMMVPLVLPTMRRVAFASLWARRDRAMGAFLVGYLAIWTASSLALEAAVEGARFIIGPIAALTLAALVALVWNLTATKRRALRSCHLMLPIAPLGWRADRDCVTLGLAVGRSCVANCWALMAVVFAAGHQPLVMLVIVPVMLSERFGWRAFRDGAITLVADLRFALGVARSASRESLVGP